MKWMSGWLMISVILTVSCGDGAGTKKASNNDVVVINATPNNTTPNNTTPNNATPNNTTPNNTRTGERDGAYLPAL